MELTIGKLGEEDRSVTIEEADDLLEIKIMVGSQPGSYAPLTRANALALADALKTMAGRLPDSTG